MSSYLIYALLGAFALKLTPVYAAPASLLDDATLCQAAIAASEQAARLPSRMLSAIGMVESGRPDPKSGIPVVWPWTTNIAGTGHFYATKADAIAAVMDARSHGIQSIDVGCTQINLMHHPRAFASLDEAFDPSANARYAATFLLQLKAQTNNWGAAVAAYHSFTPELGAPYAQHVAAMWPLAASYGFQVPKYVALAAVEPRPAQPNIDPYHVMTPEFRAQMLKDALFKRQRDMAMGAAPASASGLVLASRSHIRRSTDLAGGTMRASIGD